MWVEVRIEDDNGIRGVKVDADATSPRRQKIDEDIRVRLIKFVNTLLPECAWGITILQGNQRLPE